MGCITSIAIALWLIALAAGVQLLYKVQKENLQWPFKVAGWLITIVALGGMLCCSLRCIVNSCHGGNCGRPPMMMYHHGMMWQGPCDGEREHCRGGKCERKEACCDDEDECEEEDEHEENVKIIINKDSVIHQKK
ncbi:MAG: hypothetical protein OHK0036_03130 [Bacteroidia bacterium]